MSKVGVIDLGKNRRPHGMDVDGKTGHIVCTTENPDGMILVDPVARKVIRRYDVKGEDPHMVILEPGGAHAFVTNTATATIAAVRMSDGAVKLIPVEKRPQGGVFSKDGKLLYMTNSEGNSISIIDVGKREVVGRIGTGVGAGRAALTPDGKTLVYNLQAGKGVAFADVATRKQVKQIDLIGNPLSLTMSKDGKFVYLGIQDSDKVVIVSVEKREIVRMFDTPKNSGPDPVLPL
jgi:YVTN family beta-propeller protein